MHSLSLHDAASKRRAALALAAFLYAGFSNPTPDALGWPEIVILLLIVAAIMPVRLVRENWTPPLAVFLIYGLTVPLITAVLAGAAGNDILRDLVAFAALGLPLVLAAIYPANDINAQKNLLYCLLGIGLIFSARFIFSGALPFLAGGHDLLYLANSPLVAFAACWLLLQACFIETRPARAGGLILLALIPVIAMLGMMQRATILLLILAWFGFLIVALVKNPKRGCIVLAGFAVFIFCLWPLLNFIFASLYDKTMAVGWNARGSELQALLNQLRDNPLIAFFGAGWGSLVKSPAVGDLWVRFSHALLTSLLWKTGWVGLVLGVTAIGALVASAYRHLRHNMVLFVSLMLPLLPALFLYGSYKSLCFGLLLLGLARLDWTRPQPQ